MDGARNRPTAAYLSGGTPRAFGYDGTRSMTTRPSGSRKKATRSPGLSSSPSRSSRALRASTTNWIRELPVILVAPRNFRSAMLGSTNSWKKYKSTIRRFIRIRRFRLNAVRAFMWVFFRKRAFGRGCAPLVFRVAWRRQSYLSLFTRAETRGRCLHVPGHGCATGRFRWVLGIVWLEILAGFVLALALAFGMVRRAKTRGDQALKHPVRRRLVDRLLRRPGVRLHDLWKALGIQREKAQYHLFVLERAGAVESTPADGATRFFPAGTQEMDAWAVLMRDGAFELAAFVARHPGARQWEIRERVGFTRKVFRDHANRLAREGLIRELREWRDLRYFPTSRLERVLPAVRGERRDLLDGGPAREEDDGLG